ncbi:hypothetical protein DL96DRAFT_1615763 [Flagelloscypha sp. PMI_526]|nr:hypothetical protein DL96DRAFT_1615763 [Flagelloscypha sp. PMI_526]
MAFNLKHLLAFLLWAPLAFAQTDLRIFTPANAVLCSLLIIGWEGGVGPFQLSVFDGTTGLLLEDLGTQTGDEGNAFFSSYHWTVNVEPLGFPVDGLGVLQVADSAGASVQSGAFGINFGSSTPNTSCVDGV